MTDITGTKTKVMYGLKFIIGAFLLWGVAYCSIKPNMCPEFLSPMPKSVIFPDFILYDSIRFHSYANFLAVFVIPIIFALWSFPLLWGQKGIPIRSKILTGMMVFMSIFYLAGTWPEGVQYHGAFHTIMMYLFNALFCVLLFILARRNLKYSTYASNYLFHWFLFAWLGWVAFPYLGEIA